MTVDSAVRARVEIGDSIRGCDLSDQIRVRGFQMINQIEISNFRCFERLSISECKRINVIVGDNGSGKTALLEAIFFALGGSTELGMRFRQQRGLEGAFAGSPALIERAIFEDLFFARDLRRNLAIRLLGDGPSARQVEVNRLDDPIYVQIDDSDSEKILASGNPQMPIKLKFTWLPADGVPRAVIAQVGANNTLSLGNTGEAVEDYYYFPTSPAVGAIENAIRFSALSKAGEEKKFVDMFRKAFRNIEALSVEVSGAAPVIYANVRGVREKLPVTNVSGAVNRLLGVMLGFAISPGGVVLADELENGVYYKHHLNMWKSIINSVREFECQLFTTTHSEEWIRALLDAAGSKIDDISIWRVERDKKNVPVVSQFSGKTIKNALDFGVDVRG